MFPTEASYDTVAKLKLIFDLSVYDVANAAEWSGSRRYRFGLNDLAGYGEWRWFDTGELLTYNTNTKWAPGQSSHVHQLPNLAHFVRIITLKFLNLLYVCGPPSKSDNSLAPGVHVSLTTLL